MTSFQAKIGWKIMRQREKIKIIVPFRPYPTRNRKFQKNCKEIKKIKKYRYCFFSIQNMWEKALKESK